MLKIIIEKELKDILGSSKFVFTFVICSILILLTFYVGARSYQVNKNQYEASVAENLRSMQNLNDWGMIKHRIFLPPLPLASLVSGISNDIGRNITMAGSGELVALESKYNEDPIYAVFRFLDLDFLFQIILSLFAILFTYNAVNGEKERGTLALTFANPVPRDKYILGKLIGSFTALAVPLLIPMLLGALLLPLLGVPMNTQDWIKLVFIIVTGFLYFGVFLTLSVFMSVVMKQSSSSFLMMLVIWILFVVVIPRASIIIAGRAVGVPTVDEVNSKKNKYKTQEFEEVFRKTQLLRPTPGESQSQEDRNYIKNLRKESNQRVLDYSNKLNEERANKQILQQNLAFGISRISPSACFSLAASNAAGTSLQLSKEFSNQAAAYQNIFKQFQIKKTGRSSGSGIMIFGRGTGDEKEKIDTKELPQFNFNPPDFSRVIGKSIIDLSVLILFNLFFFFGSFIAFLKYDLR